MPAFPSRLYLCCRLLCRSGAVTYGAAVTVPALPRYGCIRRFPVQFAQTRCRHARTYAHPATPTFDLYVLVRDAPLPHGLTGSRFTAPPKALTRPDVCTTERTRNVHCGVLPFASPPFVHGSFRFALPRAVHHLPTVRRLPLPLLPIHAPHYHWRATRAAVKFKLDYGPIAGSQLPVTACNSTFCCLVTPCRPDTAVQNATGALTLPLPAFSFRSHVTVGSALYVRTTAFATTGLPLRLPLHTHAPHRVARYRLRYGSRHLPTPSCLPCLALSSSPVVGRCRVRTHTLFHLLPTPLPLWRLTLAYTGGYTPHLAALATRHLPAWVARYLHVSQRVPPRPTTGPRTCPTDALACRTTAAGSGRHAHAPLRPAVLPLRGTCTRTRWRCRTTPIAPPPGCTAFRRRLLLDCLDVT